MKEFLQRWLICTVGVLLATKIVPGITYREWHDLLMATFLLGILNAFVRPLLILLSLPFVLLTLGLFTLIINALLLLLVDWLMTGFEIAGFWQALGGALVISLVTLFLNALVGPGRSLDENKSIPSRRRPDDQGPTIDV